MRKFFVGTICLLVLFAGIAFGQEDNFNDMSLGYILCENGNDFGLGLSITSPYFFNNGIAIKLAGLLMFNSFIDSDYDQWQMYYATKLGFVGGSMINDKIRVYGEGGAILLIPNSTVSSQDYMFGGYGSFGFEFLMTTRMSFYSELGANGIAINGDSLDTNSPDYKRIYFNGFAINVGLRFYF